MNQLKRKEIFRLLKKTIKNPETELIYNSPFQLLIAVILSAQTTDIQVNKVTEELFRVAPDPKNLALLEIKP